MNLEHVTSLCGVFLCAVGAPLLILENIVQQEGDSVVQLFGGNMDIMLTASRASLAVGLVMFAVFAGSKLWQYVK